MDDFGVAEGLGPLGLEIGEVQKEGKHLKSSGDLTFLLSILINKAFSPQRCG